MELRPTRVCLALMLLSLGPQFGAAIFKDDEFSADFPFELTYLPARVVKGLTTDVTLKCEINPRVADNFREITKIRILRNPGSMWQPVAELRYGDTARTVTDGENATTADVTGNISEDFSEVFLQMEWRLAADDTFGTFKCDVLAVEQNYKNTEEITSEVEITNPDDVSVEDVMRSVQQLQEAVGMGVVPNFASKWPAGPYALLKPDTGCPLDYAFFGESASYVTFTTQARINGHSVSVGSHMSQPDAYTIETDEVHNFITFRFCEVTRKMNTDRWPEGKYCMNTPNIYACPDDSFKRGLFLSDIHEDYRSAQAVGGEAVLAGEDLALAFCCKDSGSADEAMVLPTDSPFYLYRYGGQCQEVRGMTVTPEAVLIGHEDLTNQDGGQSVLPDISVSDRATTRIELCYYAKDD